MGHGVLIRPPVQWPWPCPGSLLLIDLVSVEGPAFLLSDLSERLASEQDRRVVLDTAAALERVPELIGIGPHLLATARRRTPG